MAKSPEQVFCDLVRAGVYEIDSEGRIWRLKIGHRFGFIPCDRRRAEHVTTCGYYQMQFGHRGEKYNVHVNRIVWVWFNGPLSRDLVVDHKNGDKLDNHPGNLEAITKSENSLRANAAGLRDVRGEKHPRARLTDREVALIRNIYASGRASQYALADRFGVARPTIGGIVTGRERQSQLGPITRNRDHSRARRRNGRFTSRRRSA